MQIFEMLQALSGFKTFQFFRDQYPSACLYIRRCFVLYALTWQQVENMEMNLKEMQMWKKFFGGLTSIHFLVLGFPEAFMIMSEYMALCYEN